MRFNKMRLWLLLPIQMDVPDTDDIFTCDCYHGHVVCAETEEKARRLAFSADETRYYKYNFPNSEYENPWLDPKITACQEITNENREGVILSDFNAG